jgi:DNA-binding NtrC family response regulator
MLKTSTIMIVDDDEICRLYFRDLFSKEGYNVNTYENPLHAIESFDNKEPDVVLLDVKMPIMGGKETLRKFKEINPAVPVIMMSAYTTLEIAVDCIKLGAEDILRKPGDIEKVVEKVETAIKSNEIMAIMPKTGFTAGHNFDSKKRKLLEATDVQDDQDATND